MWGASSLNRERGQALNQPLNVERRGAVAWLTLNRPGDANSIDVAMAQALLEAVDKAADDPMVRVLVITGAGRMFCAGGDIKAFTNGGDPAAAIDAITAPLHRAIVGLSEMPKPLVTLVNGTAAGAGLGLAMLGDIVLAARSAHFTAAYTAIGLTPDAGTSWYLPRLVGLRRATDIVMTNRRVTAEEAERIGLVTRLVDDDHLIVEGERLAGQLAEGAIGSLAGARRLLAEGLGRTLADHLADEALTIARSATGGEGVEGVSSFLARRKPDFGAVGGG